MNRCAKSLPAARGRPPALALALALAFAPTLAALAPAPAAAQAVQRNFPQNALRGKITFGTAPAIMLNGNAAHLAAGYRIHRTNNLIVMASELANASFAVDYTTDMNGDVFEIWLLSAAEAAKAPWPTTPAQAAAWRFDPIAQAWTKP